MTGSASARSASARLPNGLPAALTKSLVSVWTQYAGKAPSAARTEIEGNVVTCMLIDAVDDYNRSMVSHRARDTVRGAAELNSEAYKLAAVAAVVRLTRQRVTSFISSHDEDTNVATEVFTLERSLRRGAAPARARRRSGQNLLPFSSRRPTDAMVRR
jgi:Na+-translocating membrane potential-generating system (MpsC)